MNAAMSVAIFPSRRSVANPTIDPGMSEALAGNVHMWQHDASLRWYYFKFQALGSCSIAGTPCVHVLG